MERRIINARQLRSGETVLLDPLDESTTVEVADVSKGDRLPKVKVALWQGPGRPILFGDLERDQPVTVVR